MKKLSLFTTFILLAFSLLAQKPYKYPIAEKDTTTNIYFDTSIEDPYQWMENPDDPRLNKWLEAQKKITKKLENQQIKKITLKNQLIAMYHDGKKKTIDGYIKEKTKNKNKYEFNYKNNKYKQTPDLLYRKKGTKIYKTLVKIKDFKRDKDDNVIITSKKINKDQTQIAIEMSHNGSDWREIYFFDLISGTKLNDTLRYLQGRSNLAWHKNGVYYDGYDKPVEGRELLDKAKGQTLFYHKIGTSQLKDIIIYKNPDTTSTYSFKFNRIDSSSIFLHHYIKSRGTVYKAISYVNLNNTNSFFPRNFLIYENKKETTFSVSKIYGDTVLLSTNWNAPNGKVMRSIISQQNKLVEVVPEYDINLRSVNKLGKDKIACIYRNNGKFLVLIFDLQGKLLRKIDFPEGKKVNHFYENNPNAEYANFYVSSFYHPNLWYQLSLKDLTFKPIQEVWVPFEPKDLETRYVKYKSKDGTEIPIYITCLKKTKLNGNNPTLLYGYGGYGYTVEPHFNQSQALWLLHGGILAVPNIRGGGGEGDKWAIEGRRLKKQNAIDDFISAAEYLIKENYTNSNKLAINGRSHGGLLVGAALTQRPDLFKVAIAEAGAFDMLRFDNFTGGSVSTNLNEYGTPSNLNDFNNLKSYSPLHNVKKNVKYPNVLFITGDSDDRVPPLHTYKFLATLQEHGSSESLYHLYLNPGSGHGRALKQKDWQEQLLYKYYFLFDQLGLKFWHRKSQDQYNFK